MKAKLRPPAAPEVAAAAVAIRSEGPAAASHEPPPPRPAQLRHGVPRKAEREEASRGEAALGPGEAHSATPEQLALPPSNGVFFFLLRHTTYVQSRDMPLAAVDTRALRGPAPRQKRGGGGRRARAREQRSGGARGVRRA